MRRLTFAQEDERRRIARELHDDFAQRLAALQQDGWQIQYTGYMPVGGEWLPSKLTLERQGVRLRVVVDGWNS